MERKCCNLFFLFSFSTRDFWFSPAPTLWGCATSLRFSPQKGSLAWDKHKLDINDPNMKYKLLSHWASHPLNPCVSPQFYPLHLHLWSSLTYKYTQWPLFEVTLPGGPQCWVSMWLPLSLSLRFLLLLKSICSCSRIRHLDFYLVFQWKKLE